MFGKNPLRPPEKGDGSTLFVQEIFPTLQGEGPLVGMPSVFVRLGGCNLACDFCDTEFESFSEMALEAVLEKVAGDTPLIVLTGGEPLRQNIVPLCEALLAQGFMVQIETNGTLWRPLPEAVRVVVSPKNSGKGYATLRPDVAARAEALKFIVSASHPLYRDIGKVSDRDIPVFLQPMDEYDAAKNAENLAYCVELCQKTGARLSLQTHKILGLR